jgi:hypothetical protein
MQITLEITPEQIADLMTTFIESGDPVSTASRGGWCDGVEYVSGWVSRKKDADPWYNQKELYAGGDGEYYFTIKVREIDDETTGHKTIHTVNLNDMGRGLQVMAKKYSHLFQQILADDVDAAVADIFVQCILFGEEKYA